jgi:hypothetical protein
VQLVALKEDERPELKTHVLDRGAYVCLCCFSEFKEPMHLIGHYLVHSEGELYKIGAHQHYVLQYINEQYPRIVDENPLIEDFAKGKHPIGKLLVRNSEQNDGFSGYLLRTLPELSAKEYDFEGSDIFGGVSEPNHWFLYLDKFQGVPGDRDYKWMPTYHETDLDREYEHDYYEKPIALIADGTFMYHEQPDERVAYETGAMLALVAGGVWKRHAIAHGENSRKQLAYVGWNTVYQQLRNDGRAELAELFNVFFRDGNYKEKLDKLLEKIGERDWGFADEWVELK